MELIKEDQFGLIRYTGWINHACFEFGEVWYQYYDPIEWDDFRPRGMTDEWIQTNIYDQIDDRNELYYADTQKIYTNREFSYVKCQIHTEDVVYDGYVSLVLGEVKTANILIGKEEITLYGETLLAFDENETQLKELSKHTGTGKDYSNLKFVDITFSDYVKSVFLEDMRFRLI